MKTNIEKEFKKINKELEKLEKAKEKYEIELNKIYGFYEKEREYFTKRIKTLTDKFHKKFTETIEFYENYIADLRK